MANGILYGIRRVGDPILSTTARDVDDPLSSDTQLLTMRLATLLEAMGDGTIGLAAPQIGASLRVFVMNIPTEAGGDGTTHAYINPEILEASQETETDTEGCLSCDGTYIVERPKWIVGTWAGIDGQRYEQRFDGLAARCFQHEHDHLNGLLITRFQRVAG